MCELLGLSAKKPVDAREYLKIFYSHSVRHPHGWGIMRFTDGKREIIKEGVRASGSRIISETIRKTEPQTNMLAHIRLATVGAVKYENSHPYTSVDISGREWTLIHNGTIYSGTKLSKYLTEQAGDTDSERVFLYLMDEINKAIELKNGALDKAERFAAVEKIVISLAPRNKLNLMIFDGELLYVHKNMRNTLAYKELDEGVIISTEPLDSDKWESFPMTQLIAFEDGNIVFEGNIHKHEFVPTLDYITAMDAMNI